MIPRNHDLGSPQQASSRKRNRIAISARLRLIILAFLIVPLRHAPKRLVTLMSRSLILVVFLLCLGFVQCCITASPVAAQQGLKRGDPVGVFYVTKVAGAEDDGVSPGEHLCYRCRYGSRPLVMVFARKTGNRLTDLVHRLDRAVVTHRRTRLKGLVTFLGRDASELKACAASVAETATVKAVPVVIAAEATSGPTNYKLSENADITIVVAKDSQVIETHSYDVNHIDVATVMSRVEQIAAD
jgi:hypothetical protein